MIEEVSLRQRSVTNLAGDVFTFKKTLKRWFYYAGLKYLQTHKLTDAQEAFLEDITDYLVEAMDNVEKDRNFFKKIKFEPLKMLNN